LSILGRKSGAGNYG